MCEKSVDEHISMEGEGTEVADVGCKSARSKAEYPIFANEWLYENTLARK